jgi:hypothetical protein
MIFKVPSIVLESSIKYNKEKDGTAIKNKIKLGSKVQTISSV